MNHIEAVGVTDQRKCYIVSREKSLRINEFLMIEDAINGDTICQVLETNTYNKFIPMSMTGEIADKEVLANLRNIGIDIDQETIYFGVARLIREADYPIETGSNVRIPTFDEVRKYFIAAPVEKSLNIGVIRNTDDVYRTMDEDLRDLCMTFEDQKLLKNRKKSLILMGLYSMQEYPHVGIFGGSGSGKSFGMRVILEELMQKEMPAIVLDLHFEMDFTQNSQKGYGGDYEETDLSSEETKRLPYLNTGDAFISQVQASRSMYIRIRAAHTDTPHKENPFDELNKQTEGEMLTFRRNISNFLPIDEFNLTKILDEYEKMYSINSRSNGKEIEQTSSIKNTYESRWHRRCI